MINMDEQTINREFVESEFASFSQMYNLGIEKLKEEQIDVMVAVLNKKDTVGILPTGFGKSIVFYAMPFLKEKVRLITLI